jgi:UDP-glucose 4-epimerase
MTIVLVTGAAGFIGSQLARHFRQAGARVFVDAERGHSAGTTRWPLSESSLLQAMQGERPDVIFHAAGSGTVAKVAAQPTLELPANLGAFLAVLQFVRAYAPQAHVVLLSSAALYGNAPARPQHETDVRPPVSLYGLAKAQAEQLAEHYASHLHVRSTVVRLFSVYGPELRKQLLWDAMRKFSAGESEFFGTGQEQRDWVHIRDVCSFMDQLLARRDESPFQVFNCAGSAASTAEVLTALAQASGVPEVRFNGQSRAGDPACLVADCSKALTLLGWAPTVGWREGVQGYAQWFAQLGQHVAVGAPASAGHRAGR